MEAIRQSPDALSTVADTASAIIENFKGLMGVRGARLYERRDGGYELTRTFGDVKAVEPRALRARRVSAGSARPGRRRRRHGPREPGVDPEFEKSLGVDRFAAIAVGEDQYILSFSVDPGSPDEDLMSSLGILRHAVDQKLRQESRYVTALNRGAADPDVDPAEALAQEGGGRHRRLHVPGRARRRRLLRFHSDFRPDRGRRHRGRLGARPAGGAPGAGRLHGTADGRRARLQDRADDRKTEPHYPPVTHDHALRVALLRRDRGRRQLHVRQRRPPASPALPRPGRDAARADGHGPRALGDVDLSAGDSAAWTGAMPLLLYTDGMAEATTTTGRVRGRAPDAAFLANRDRPCDEIARNLVERVNEYTGDAMPEDDQTCRRAARGGPSARRASDGPRRRPGRCRS